MRLFVAVRPPAAALAQLAAALGRRPDPKWHLTLAFLGERPATEPLLDPLQEVALGHPVFELSLRGGGTFGGRVLWVGITGEMDALRALADDVRRAVGVTEERPFRAHLTLARGRGLVVPAGLAALEGQPWSVTEVELVHSILGRSAQHQLLRSFPLAT